MSSYQLYWAHKVGKPSHNDIDMEGDFIISSVDFTYRYSAVRSKGKLVQIVFNKKQAVSSTLRVP